MLLLKIDILSYEASGLKFLLETLQLDHCEYEMERHRASMWGAVRHAAGLHLGGI
jgi:hypothetical protein